MATIKNGLLSGRVGKQIYYARNGKQLVRSLPEKRKIAASPAALQQRATMKMVVQFLSPLKEIIRYTCLPYHGKISGMNRAVQQVFREALIKENNSYRIDQSKAKMSIGTLMKVSIKKLDVKNGRIAMQWYIAPHNDFMRVFLLAYNVEEQTVQLSAGGELYRDGQLSMELNEEILNGSFHLYAYVSNRMGTAFSDSVYLGEFSY